MESSASFRRVYPNTTGGVVGGRATFRDSRGRGDTFTACAAVVRAYVFGELYDEVDISRSHVSHVAGCWLISGAAHPLTLTRLLDDRDKGTDHLEQDIRGDLLRARPAASSHLSSLVAQAGGVPTLSPAGPPYRPCTQDT